MKLYLGISTAKFGHLIISMVSQCINSSTLPCLNVSPIYLWYAQIATLPKKETIVPFHKDLSPSGEQLEHRKLAHEL